MQRAAHLALAGALLHLAGCGGEGGDRTGEQPPGDAAVGGGLDAALQCGDVTLAPSGDEDGDGIDSAVRRCPRSMSLSASSSKTPPLVSCWSCRRASPCSHGMLTRNSGS